MSNIILGMGNITPLFPVTVIARLAEVGINVNVKDIFGPGRGPYANRRLNSGANNGQSPAGWPAKTRRCLATKS